MHLASLYGMVEIVEKLLSREDIDLTLRNSVRCGADYRIFDPGCFHLQRSVVLRNHWLSHKAGYRRWINAAGICDALCRKIDTGRETGSRRVEGCLILYA